MAEDNLRTFDAAPLPPITDDQTDAVLALLADHGALDLAEMILPGVAS